MNRLLKLALLLVLVACERNPQAKGVPLDLPRSVSFMVQQRSTTPLPGSDGRVMLTIDDITLGQVMASLTENDGRVMIATRSLHAGEAIGFSLGGHDYLLKLQRLENRLIGMDYAHFDLYEKNSAPLPISSLDADLKRLYDALRAATGARFIRAGQEYDVETMIAHLERKRVAASSSVTTLEDFIQQIGSRSLQTDEAYKIRFPDGTEYELEVWMRQRMAGASQ